MSIRSVFREGWHLYVQLFWRSLFITAAIFLVLDAVGAAVEASVAAKWAVFLASTLVAILTGFGDLVVEGALAEDALNVHQGREPPSYRGLVRRVAPRLWLLAAASLVYAAGTNVGLLLLIVPGLLLATRWSLIAPVIVLENRGLRDGFRRSWRLVKGHSWRVFLVVVILFLASALLESLGQYAFDWLPEFYADWIGGYLASLVAAPYVAHTLLVLYYRLAEVDQSSGSSTSG